MEKPLAVIISGNDHVSKSLETTIRSHPLGFSTKRYPNIGVWKEKNGNGNSPQAFFIDYSTAHGDSEFSNGVEVSDEVSNRYPLTANVMMSEDDAQHTESDSVRDISDHNKNIKAWMPLNMNATKVHSTIDALREKKCLVRPLSIGIIGLGKLGSGVLSGCQEDNWIKRIEAFSNLTAFRTFVGEKYPAVAEQLQKEFGRKEWDYGSLDLLNEASCDRPTIYHNAFEKVIGANPDVLLITTGMRVGDLEHYPEREDLLRGTFPKVDPILRQLEDRKKLVFLESNPPGFFLRYGHERYGLDPSIITSISADNWRQKSELVRLLNENPGTYIQPGTLEEYTISCSDLEISQVCLDIIGEHGYEFPLVDSCSVRDRDLFPEFLMSDYNFVNELVTQARPKGKAAMVMAGIWGQNYIRTPISIRHALENIAHFQQPSSCWYCPMGDEPGPLQGAFLQWPTKLDYNGEDVKLSREYEVVISRLQPQIFKGVIAQAEAQKLAVSSYSTVNA